MANKRKTSPKFHFLKSRRKALLPAKLEEFRPDTEAAPPEDAASGHEEEAEPKERCESQKSAEAEGPVDFTIKNEQFCSSPELPDKEVPDMGDMAAFLASAQQAVRNAGHFQVRYFFGCVYFTADCRLVACYFLLSFIIFTDEPGTHGNVSVVLLCQPSLFQLHCHYTAENI